MPEITTLLQAHHAELRAELRAELNASAYADGEPQPGSDIALLLEALTGAPLAEQLCKFEASGRQLIEHGGRLETRLASIQECNMALERAFNKLFADNPAQRADAHQLLGSIIGQMTAALARGAQHATCALADSEAERARRGLTRLQALQRINAAANSTLDLDQTLSTTASAVAQEMGVDLCTVFLFDEITRELQLRATNGPLPLGSWHHTTMIGDGYTGWVAEHGHPLLLPDALTDGRFEREARAYDPPYVSVLAVPIIFFTVEKLEGVISVQTREPRTFTPEEVNFLEIVAGQLAMSIENGRLYEQTDEELRRKVHELSTLHRVSAMVASTLVFDNVLRTIVAQAVQLSGADRSVLFGRDATTGTLSAVASHGFDSEVDRATVRVGQCCAGIVVQTGEPRMQIDCMRSDEGCFLHDRKHAIDDQHSVLCVPLTTRHGPLGALCVFSSQRHLLNNHQLQLVMTFANVAAMAMENARLFEETREGLRTKEVLLREMHHRVKNNLQQVASILSMQRRRARSPEVEQILAESVDRIQGIAATHDLLSNAELGIAPIDEISRKIVGVVRANLVPPQLRIRFTIGVMPQPLPSEQATTLAIMLNEIVANAIEHGFEGRQEAEIRITGQRENCEMVVRVADDGVGLPENFSLQSSEGLGLQLVRGLAQSDLHGSVRIFTATGNPDIGRLPEPPTDGAAAGSASREPKDAAGNNSEDKRRWTIIELRFPVIRFASTEPAVAEDTSGAANS